MNLQQPGSNDAITTRNRSRDVSPLSGICTRCVDNCTGNCDIFKASLRGRETPLVGRPAFFNFIIDSNLTRTLKYLKI